MSISLRFAAFSDIGLVRSINQDAGYASSHLLVLADGMGGAAAGDIASSVTVGHLAQIDDDIHTADELLPTLRTAIEEAHADLMSRAHTDPEISGLGTTCIAILRSNNKLAMVHIGDSRAYLFRTGTLTQVTKDHTLVQYLVDQGQLTPEEAEHHPKRNVITRALGDTPGRVDLDESAREAIIGDRWLLSSDGLFGVVAHDTIEHTLATYTDLTECGNHLIELALAAGAPDNVTVVLADIVDGTDSSVGLQSQAPIVVGSAAVDPGWHSRGGGSAAAAAAQLFTRPEVPKEILTEPESKPSHRTSRVGAKLAVTAAVLALVGSGIFWGYSWSQHQYYISTKGGYVTIFQGLPHKFGPLNLSSVRERTTTKVTDLLPVAQERLATPIMRSSLADARAVVENLRELSMMEPQNTAPSYTPPDDPTAGSTTAPSFIPFTNPTQEPSAGAGA